MSKTFSPKRHDGSVAKAAKVIRSHVLFSGTRRRQVRNMSKTCPSKCYGGSVAEVANVIRDNMVIGGKSFAWYSESVNVRKDEFDTKTSEASHGFLERMPNLDTKNALAILGRELVENNTLKKCFVGRWVETVCVCVQTHRGFECCRGFHDRKAPVSCLRGFSSDVMQLFRMRRNDQHIEVGGCK